MRNVNEVTTPKLPPPPPWQAQNRSAYWSGSGGEHRAVRRDNLQGLKVVTGQAVRPGGYADATAERQAGDADGRAGAARHRAALGRQAVVEVDEPGARADRRGRAGHGDRLQVGDVDDQPARPRPAGVAVTTGAGRERDAELADERQARRHVMRVLHVRDPRRALTVEPGVEQQAGVPVAGVAGTDQRAGQVLGEGGPVGGSRACRACEDAGWGERTVDRSAGDRGAGDYGYGDRSGSACGDTEECAALQRTLCRLDHISNDASGVHLVARFVIT